MIFNETKLKGSFEINIEEKDDERGFFARLWDTKIFEEKGLNSKIVQCNISFSKKKGTLRGMHYQIHPFEETKVVRCTRGAIYDVIIDVRSESSTYKKWEAFELSANNRKMVYVPEGFAHGFQSLEVNTEIFYQVSQFYTANSEQGIRWDDPEFNIKWPMEVMMISQKDASWKNFSE